MLLSVFLLAILAGQGAPTTKEECPSTTPEDYTNIEVRGDICYEFLLNFQRTYDEAEKDCESRGGTLPLVKDVDTHNYLILEIRKRYTGGSEVWIGLHDKGQESTFVWEDGTTLGSFNFWKNGIPATYNIYENCVGMNPSLYGLWSDHTCNDDDPVHYGSKLRYICQYNASALTTTTTVTTPTTLTTMTKKPQSTMTPIPGPTSCPLWTCDITCGSEGYMKDETTGCRVCKCNEY